MAGTLTITHVCSWGIDANHMISDTLIGTGSGIVYDFSKNIDPIRAPEHNELGQVIGQTQYDERKTINATLQVAHGVTPPNKDDILTIDNEKYYILNISLAESNQSYSRYTIGLERYHRTDTGFVTLPTGAFT